MDERRSSRRWRAVLGGQIVVNNRTTALLCTVRDLSDTGARIYFADASAIPAEFEFEIPSRGIRIPSVLVWTRGANHGVMFLEKVKAWTDPWRAVAA